MIFVEEVASMADGASGCLSSQDGNSSASNQLKKSPSPPHNSSGTATMNENRIDVSLHIRSSPLRTEGTLGTTPPHESVRSNSEKTNTSVKKSVDDFSGERLSFMSNYQDFLSLDNTRRPRSSLTFKTDNDPFLVANQLSKNRPLTPHLTFSNDVTNTDISFFDTDKSIERKNNDEVTLSESDLKEDRHGAVNSKILYLQDEHIRGR